MTRLIVVILGLLAAIHVTVINIPAPVPAFLAAGGVIAVLLFLIWEAAHPGNPRHTKPASLWTSS